MRVPLICESRVQSGRRGEEKKKSEGNQVTNINNCKLR